MRATNTVTNTITAIVGDVVWHEYIVRVERAIRYWVRLTHTPALTLVL
ncbi:hypothetical protein QTO31_08190 [Chloroflexus sp. MS-CIW-1]|nr:hypothetical protein [Chloroflexus sp. MS-CIW-1]MBO9349110.1 hypothetical protein [Chloroflexus sp.]MDN5271949.1 hypothetical protein [Chloroflexus sp. MS-CIW-1]